jgi:hypothetical protein
MKKTEAEPAIRALCHQWKRDTNQPTTPNYHYSFSAFTTWLSENRYDHYLDFRSRAGPRYDAEMWFDDEMKQTWRN